jgi:hypothetical protein
LPRPLKDLLAITLDARRGARDGDRHLITRRRELRLLRGAPQPPNDVGKVCVRAGEIDRALRLDVEEGVRAVSIDRVDRHVIEWPAMSRLLKSNRPRDSAGKTARLTLPKQRQEVK